MVDDRTRSSGWVQTKTVMRQRRISRQRLEVAHQHHHVAQGRSPVQQSATTVIIVVITA
jgi:hypothetical protein